MRSAFQPTRPWSGRLPRSCSGPREGPAASHWSATRASRTRRGAGPSREGSSLRLSTQGRVVSASGGFIVTNLSLLSRVVVRFYNKRGTAEQWIKEGKQAVAMTRLCCHRFRANQVRLWLSVLAYNLGNLWRRLALPARIGNWSLTSLQQRLVKTGGRLLKHARYYWLLLVESHLTRRLFGAMVGRIESLPLPAG